MAKAKTTKTVRKPLSQAVVYEATLPDGRVFTQDQDYADVDDADAFTAIVDQALAWEAAGFEGQQPNETLRIEQTDHASLDPFEQGDFVARFYIDGAQVGGNIAADPSLFDLLTTLRQSEDDEPMAEYAARLREEAEAGDEEEAEQTGSVVPDVFKKRYAEAGHPGHCGDWLAVTLNGLVQVTDGKKVITDLDRLEAIATANGVEVARVDKLGTATNGWQGRYRMTVRNMLAKKVADKGFLFVPEGCGRDKDTELKAPKDWCAKYATKTKAKKVVDKDPGAGKASAKTAAKGKAAPAPSTTEEAPAKPKRSRGTKADRAAVTA